MALRRRNLAIYGIAAALLALGVAWVILGRGHGSKITVIAKGHTARLSGGTTVGEAASLLGLRPRAGDLVDVEGRVLRRGTVPGELLLNGRAVAPTTKLGSGDRLAVRDGQNQSEPLRRVVVPARDGIPGEPQFTVSRRPGTVLLVQGALSHELVSMQLMPSPGRPTVQRAVALTFDDGPSPHYTPRVLAILRRLHVPATFFVVGYLAEQHPSLVQRELAAGMTVGNHSYNHPEVPPFDQLPPRLRDDEILLGTQSLRRAGADPMLFRPPGGSFSPQVIRAAERHGERSVLWSVDPRDWQPGTTSRQIVRAVLAAVRPGGSSSFMTAAATATAARPSPPCVQS